MAMLKPTSSLPRLRASQQHAARAVNVAATRGLRRCHRLAPPLRAVADDGGGTDGSGEGDDKESAVRQGWDPEGLFGAAPKPGQMGDLFAAREARRRAQQQQQQSGGAAAAATAVVAPPSPPPPPVQQPKQPAAPSPAQVLAQARPIAAPVAAAAATAATAIAATASAMPFGHDPVAPSDLAAGGAAASGARGAALAAALAARHMPVDLDATRYPGLRVLSWEPPIVSVDGFLTKSECEAIVAAATATGRMAASRVGAGNASGGEGTARDARRTSSSMLVDGAARAAAPELAALTDEVQRRAAALLSGGGSGDASGSGSGSDNATSPSVRWSAPGKLPPAGVYTFESPQVARYTEGQHFLSHEDAFPTPLAARNGFNRHATVLLYLNDVEQGGATRFDLLDVAVRPRAGRALIFFPAFADGTPDARTLHTAEAAVDEKFVMQQWVARGWRSVSGSGGVGEAAAPASAAPVVAKTTVATVAAGGGGGKRGGKRSGGGKKGFGR